MTLLAASKCWEAKELVPSRNSAAVASQTQPPIEDRPGPPGAEGRLSILSYQNMSKFNSKPEKARNRESSNPAPHTRTIASKFSTSNEIAGIVFKRAFAIAVMAAPQVIGWRH
jgi:hypothetical protein